MYAYLYIFLDGIINEGQARFKSIHFLQRPPPLLPFTYAHCSRCSIFHSSRYRRETATSGRMAYKRFAVNYYFSIFNKISHLSRVPQHYEFFVLRSFGRTYTIASISVRENQIFFIFFILYTQFIIMFTKKINNNNKINIMCSKRQKPD